MVERSDVIGFQSCRGLNDLEYGSRGLRTSNGPILKWMVGIVLESLVIEGCDAGSKMVGIK
jgi:hypothetical protein